VVACAVKGEPPPPELSIIWQCRRYGCLPDAGGYMDQDAVLMDKAAIYEDVYSLTKKWRGMKPKSFDGLSDGEKSLFKWLRELEIDI
jgi:hypothetical protein